MIKHPPPIIVSNLLTSLFLIFGSFTWSRSTYIKSSFTKIKLEGK